VVYVQKMFKLLPYIGFTKGRDQSTGMAILHQERLSNMQEKSELLSSFKCLQISSRQLRVNFDAKLFFVVTLLKFVKV